MYQLSHPDRAWAEAGYQQAQYQQQNNALPPPEQWDQHLSGWPGYSPVGPPPAHVQEREAVGAPSSPLYAALSNPFPSWTPPQPPASSSLSPSGNETFLSPGTLPPEEQGMLPEWALTNDPYNERLWQGEQAGLTPSEILGLPSHPPVKTAAWYAATGETPGIFGSVYAWEGEGQVPNPENTHTMRLPQPTAKDLIKLRELRDELERQESRKATKRQVWEESIPLFWKLLDPSFPLYPRW